MIYPVYSLGFVKRSVSLRNFNGPVRPCVPVPNGSLFVPLPTSSEPRMALNLKLVPCCAGSHGTLPLTNSRVCQGKQAPRGSLPGHVDGFLDHGLPVTSLLRVVLTVSVGLTVIDQAVFAELTRHRSPALGVWSAPSIRSCCHVPPFSTHQSRLHWCLSPQVAEERCRPSAWPEPTQGRRAGPGMWARPSQRPLRRLPPFLGHLL